MGLTVVLEGDMDPASQLALVVKNPPTRHGGEGRRGWGRWMERVTWRLTIPCVKQIPKWEFAVWLREVKQGFCDNLEGWGGVGREMKGSFKREGTYIYLWLILLDFDRKKQNS